MCSCRKRHAHMVTALSDYMYFCIQNSSYFPVLSGRLYFNRSCMIMAICYVLSHILKVDYFDHEGNNVVSLLTDILFDTSVAFFFLRQLFEHGLLTNKTRF